MSASSEGTETKLCQATPAQSERLLFWVFLRLYLGAKRCCVFHAATVWHNQTETECSVRAVRHLKMETPAQGNLDFQSKLTLKKMLPLSRQSVVGCRISAWNYTFCSNGHLIASSVSCCWRWEWMTRTDSPQSWTVLPIWLPCKAHHLIHLFPRNPKMLQANANKIQSFIRNCTAHQPEHTRQFYYETVSRQE